VVVAAILATPVAVVVVISATPAMGEVAISVAAVATSAAVGILVVEGTLVEEVAAVIFDRPLSFQGGGS
jgi:hypothetical protein